jgi:hypothetical protein
MKLVSSVSVGLPAVRANRSWKFAILAMGQPEFGKH